MPFFLVVVHDVAPPFLEDIRGIIGQLRPLVGSTIAAGLVPSWHGSSDAMGASAQERLSLSPTCWHEPDFTALVRATFDEVLLHGWTHYRPSGGLLSALTGGADEFAALPAASALARLQAGQRVLKEQFGRAASGFIPPAWQIGRVASVLAQAGFSYRLGWTRFETVSGEHIPLATWSWDLGRIAGLGMTGDLLGASRALLRRDAIPCVALHPADLKRGYLAHAEHLIRKLLAAGRRPIVPMQLLCGSE